MKLTPDYGPGSFFICFKVHKYATNRGLTYYTKHGIIKVEVIGMAKFEVGKTYGVRSICDSDCIFWFKVVKRTAKTVTITDGRDTWRRGIWMDPEWFGDNEVIRPLGKYSMSPILVAGRDLA